MLVADIMEAFRDDVTESYTDPKLERYVARAVAYYSRFAPRVLTATLATVADQQELDLPDGCVLVTGAIWYPGGSWGSYEEWFTWEQMGAPSIAAQGLYPSMAEKQAEDIERADRHRRALGGWEQRGTKIALFPTPESDGLDVEIVYTAHHAVSNGGAEYATIPDAHFNAVVKLVIAEHLEAKVTQRANQVSYTEGVTVVRKGHMPENLAAQVSRLRQEALAEIGTWT